MKSALLLLVTPAAAPLVKAALLKVTVKLVISLAFAWAVAEPEKLNLTTVSLIFCAWAVSPAGVLVKVTSVVGV